MLVPILLIIFVLGYAFITLEHTIHINKSATALITAVLCWTLIVLNASDKELVIESLTHHLSSISEIVFFLLGAMTIVELIDAHDGFQNIAEAIKTTNKTKLIWLIAIITFFLSAVLDNLTTTIVMISILNKLIEDKKNQMDVTGSCDHCFKCRWRMEPNRRCHYNDAMDWRSDYAVTYC